MCTGEKWDQIDQVVKIKLNGVIYLNFRKSYIWKGNMCKAGITVNMDGAKGWSRAKSAWRKDVKFRGMHKVVVKVGQEMNGDKVLWAGVRVQVREEQVEKDEAEI